MSKILKYRTGALFLTAIFCLFNIGLPMVLATCPMSDDPQAVTCAVCLEPPLGTTESFARAKNTSCCATVIAADRNTTDFVQSKVAAKEEIKSFVVSLLPTQADLHQATPTSIVFDSQKIHGPPTLDDIPVFVSSLLI